jgi:hypothetical protein
VCDGRSFTAFSGRGVDVDDPTKGADAMRGPLPPGTYYILDRNSAGHLGWLRDAFHSYFNGYDVTKWFMLWRDNGNGKVEDSTLFNGVMRGQFRLHPIGPLGLSEGCITVMDVNQFDSLRDYLLRSPQAFVPGTSIRYYGTVTVK